MKHIRAWIGVVLFWAVTFAGVNRGMDYWFSETKPCTERRAADLTGIGGMETRSPAACLNFCEAICHETSLESFRRSSDSCECWCYGEAPPRAEGFRI